MRYAKYFIFFSLCSVSLFASTTNDQVLRQEIKRLQEQAALLEQRLNHIQQQKTAHSPSAESKKTVQRNVEIHSHIPPYAEVHDKKGVHSSLVEVHALNKHPESVEFYPTALVSEGHVVTFIAGTPVIVAPYLGSRPSFDGSDYIVNISSINRDVRLMEQRRRLYRAYESMGYPVPNTPIVALSGKAEPIGSIGSSFTDSVTGDWDLSSAELDTAVSLNDKVQAYISLAYNPSPSPFNNQLVDNSSVNLGMGFINIGDLDETPWYLTAGQLFVPYGRYSSGMISAPLTMIMSRTKARPFIVGYKSQGPTGPFAAGYAFSGDTNVGGSSVGGLNLGYIYDFNPIKGEVGVSYISSLTNAGGMQLTSGMPGTFGGFGSLNHGSEYVRRTPGVDVHGNVQFDRYTLTAEWTSATEAFRVQDLSFNGRRAQPQAGQVEAGLTFKWFDRPSSFNVGYQWTEQALALNLPKERYSAVFSMSIWRDTVESIEYRHDIDYRQGQFANGSAPVGITNLNTTGSGKSSDMVLARIGVYF